MAEKTEDPPEVSGIPVDGELYKVRDLTASEQRELRRILRDFTGQEQGTLEYFIDFGIADDCDVIPAVTYLIRKRTEPDYKLEQTDDLDLDKLGEEAVRLTKAQGRRPRKPRAAAPTSES